MSDLHVIRKQIFQFRLEEESQYRLLARRISELGDRILPEALDEVLSDFVPEGVHIVIDRLELDIGVIHPDEIREQLANRIVAALRQSLQAIGTGRQPGVARVADGPGRQAAILEHFVRHGRLPWWAGSRNVSIREYARKLTEADPALITRIFGQYIQDPPRMKRLLQHLDTPALIKAWSRSHPESKAVSEPEMAGIIREVTRHLQVQYGSDRAVEMIRFQLLQGLLQQTRRTFTGDGRSIGSILSGGVSRLAGVLLTEIPVTGWIDFSLLITDLPRRESGRLTKPEAVDRHKDSRTLKLREALSGGEGAPGGPPAGKPPSDEVSDRELAAFGGFLRQGTINMRPSASLSGSVVSIFRTLIRERLQELAGMIRDLGKADRVRKRILDSIPSPRLRTFFEAAVPGKKEAMEWVESVYLETQRKVRPINQTNIRVQRSVDEITLELFTTTDLNAISNLAFMRFHIRRMALKHHIRYRDLIRAIWRSSNLYRISPDGRLFAILKELYEEAFPLRKLSDGRHAPDSTDRILVDDQIRPADRVALDPGWEARQAERIHEDLVREIKGPQSSPLSTPEGGGEQRPRINEDLAPGLAADSATILPRRSEDSRSDIKQGRSGDLTEDFSTDDGVPVQTKPSSQVSDVGGVADSSFAGPIPENKAGIAAGTVLEADRTAIRPMTGQSTGKDITSGSTADGKSSREAGSLSADDLAAPVGATSDMQNRQTSGPTIDKLVSEGTAQALQANAESDARDPDGKGRSSDLSDGQGSEGIGDADVGGSDTAPLLDGRQWKSNDPASRSMTSGQMDDRTRLADGPTNDLGKSQSSRQNSEEDGLQPASTASGTQQARATSDTSTSSPGGKEEFGYPEAADRSRTGGSGIAGTDQRTASGQISPTFGLEDSITGRIQEGKGPGSLSAGIPGDGNEVGAGGDRVADQGGIRTPIDLLEPVPQGLLDILPRSVVRALIMVKATQVFGRHTRTLQELISTYIRISSPVAISLDDADIPALMAGLSEYLGVEQSFLIFAFSYSARVHGNDPVAVRVAERFAAIQQVELPLPMNTADGLVTPLTDALVRHLTAYRWYYEATHIKSLLLPGIRGRRISPAQFSSILRLLYDDRAEIVEAEWTKLIGRSYAVSVRVDAETLIDEARHVFIEASLDAGTVSFGLQRIFARVRRILQPETSGATILPARLSEIRGYFTPDPGLQPSAGGRKKLQLRRENAIIRFYNLLNLDLVLEGVGERFFDNIPFSFELLLTKHRTRLLEILHTHRFDEELAHFFSYSDPSRLFEQIRKLYPRAHIDRVSRIFTQATELLSRARWLTLGREELQSFAGLDAFAFYLSPDSPPPAMSEVVFEVLRRASAGGLLSDSFKKMLDESTDARILSQVARRIGVRRRDLLFPVFSSESMLSDRRGLIRFRELVRSVVGVGEDEAAVLTLQAVLTTGRFPEGHVLREAVPAAHPEYLKRLVSRGNTIERLFSDSGMDLTALPEGLLDRGQLTRAVAARFRIRRDQARRLTQSWFDRAAGTGWRMEDLLELLLQSPAPSPKQPGNQVLNRAAAKLLIDAGRSSWWELLLQTGEAGSVSDPSLAGVRPEDVLDRVRGSREDWMELYFGLMQGPTDVSMSVRRAMAVWMRVLAFQPGGSSRRIRFRSLVNFVRQGITAGAATEEKLHLAWLDAGRFFDRLPPSSVLVVYGRLLKAGMEPGVIDKHLVSAGISPPDPVQKEQLRSASASEISDRLMRGLVTPEEIARLWRPGRRDAAAMLTALKRWVSSRYWNAKSADRLARQLPPQAMQSLLESLFIGVDIHRIVEAWSVFLQRSGLFADRARAVAEIRKQLFTQRLWSHMTNRRIQVELMVSLGIPEAMHRGNIPADVIRDGIDGVPGVFLKLAADLSATRPDLSVDELLPIWPLAWTDSSVPSPVAQSDRSQRVPGIGPVPQSVMDFLETGLFPDQVPGIDPETINNQMADAVRLAGPGTFLTLPSLHESLEGKVLEFFDPTVLSDYIFSTLQDTVPDAALRRYLGVLADLAAHTRVSMSDLLRFLKTFRRFFTRGKGGGVGQPEAFLRASLGIPAFAKLAHRALSAMPVAAFRTTRSPFLQHIIRKSLTGGRARRPDLHALGVYFLRTGLLHPDAVGIDLSGLSDRLRERLLAGDPDLRATIFLYAKDRLARRRVRELLDALPERDIYAWIQPGLPEALRMLTDIFSRRLRIDIWRAVGARTVRDRLERILFWWSQTRPVPGHPVRLLRPILSQVLMVMDERQWDRIRNPDLAVFTLQEKSLWAELRALLPELIQAPADGERRLAQPETEGTEGPRMNDPDMDSNPADGITVQNGGLVILWPYLGRLFTRLGFSDGKTFSSEEDQSRAIRLTEYLVTGMTEMEEHQLALNKVICGASLEFQVPASIDLTPEEEEICGKMLQGVIRNWEKMKTTRPNTFRETFLKREARLYKVEDRWELVVSRKAYDMLLDSLPWNISMIQLSWMPERLVVHWK